MGSGKLVIQTSNHLLQLKRIDPFFQRPFSWSSLYVSQVRLIFFPSFSSPPLPKRQKPSQSSRRTLPNQWEMESISSCCPHENREMTERVPSWQISQLMKTLRPCRVKSLDGAPASRLRRHPGTAWHWRFYWFFWTVMSVRHQK